MKKVGIGMAVIVLLVAGVVAAKYVMAGPPAPPAGGPIAPAQESAARAQVFLFADPREAGSSCGCGEVFRVVRAAGTRGVATREVDPSRDPELVRRYRVTVEPTVLVLDADGREIARREGESQDVIAALRTDLDRLASGGT